MTRVRSGILRACVLFALSVVGSAEAADMRGSIEFTRLAIPDDVPAHLCSALAQDHEGFLWIGTQGGLVRYDGYRFRVYRSDPADDTTLGGSYVRALTVGRDDRLWIGTFSGGLSVFDPATETFKRFRHDPRAPSSLTNDRVEGIAEDLSGRIWVATDQGLDRIEPGGNITHFRHDPNVPSSLADDRVRGLLVDRAGRLWVGSRDGLQRFNNDTSAFERVASSQGVPGSLAAQNVNKIVEDARGRIWVATAENGAVVVDASSGGLIRRFDPMPKAKDGLSHFWVYGITEVGGEIWIATFGGGVDVVDGESLEIVDRLRHDAVLENSIGGDRVGAILRDRSGVVWVGSWGEGIARHDPTTRAFRTIRNSPNRPDGLTYPAAVRALEMRDGSIWVGTNGNGIDILGSDGRLTDGHRPSPDHSGALADGSITCLAQANDATIWVATLDGVLHRLRPGSRHFERLTAADGLPRGPIRAMTFGPAGELWVGAAEGMARIDPVTSEITAWRHDPEDEHSLSGNAVEAIALASNGELWVGTTSGLNLFDPVRGTATRILRDPARRDSLPDNWVPDLLVARDGRLWIATQAGAYVMSAWDGKNAKFESVSARLGRDASPVESIIEDADGWIWLGPTLRVDARNWTAEEFGPADGCAFRNFFFASRSRCADGRLLFGSPEGLLVVRPSRITNWSFDPYVVATSLRVDGVERKGASRLRAIELEPRSRGFRLDFAALDLSAPQRNMYRYWLEGFDRGWTATDASQSSLSYTHLPPGTYTLRVGGTNRSGLWSPRELRVEVRVLPAFYQTYWFRAVAILLLAALAWAAYRVRVRAMEARSRRLERLVAERTVELADKNTQLESAYVRIEEASLTDPLTLLRNRRYLEQLIDGDLEISTRRHEEHATPDADSGLVFLLVDLDHFKQVNDTHGHAAGDAVLVQVASILRSVFRGSDHLIRWGGEEFLVVARFVDRGDASSLAEKLRAAVEEHPFELPDGTVIRKTCSIGTGAFPFTPARPRAITWQGLVVLCDLALYAAKRSGRNGWVSIAPARGNGDPGVGARFREDPEGAVANGEVDVETSATIRDLKWS